MKKVLMVMLLVTSIVFSAMSYSFTDSTGRVVDLKNENIDNIAVSGPLAQMMVFALAPEKLVGFSTTITEEEKEYIPKKYQNLPVLGQLYGTHGKLNLESLLSTHPDVIIDMGEPKNTIVDDMNDIQEKTNIPTVHISCYLNSYGEAFRQLGKLLNMEEEAEILAQYCEQTYSIVLKDLEKIDKKRCVYLLGDKGLNVIANQSYHAELLNLLTENIAVIDNPTSKGTGNEIDMEQLLVWQPDVILFAPGSVYSKVSKNYIWRSLKAIKAGTYYEVPSSPYNWLGFPPSVQRYLGMIWLESILYPEDCSFNVYQEVSKFFSLFYHSYLTKMQFENIVGK